MSPRGRAVWTAWWPTPGVAASYDGTSRTSGTRTSPQTERDRDAAAGQVLGSPSHAGSGVLFVVISSIAGHLTHPFFGAYPVSKAAVEELVRNAADEYGEANIRFNAVRPGLTLTDSMAFVTPDSPIYQSYDLNTPMGDGSDVDDVGELVSFLLSQLPDA